jgi:hypothetical protein
MANTIIVNRACTLYNQGNVPTAFAVNDVVQPTSPFYQQLLQIGYAVDSGAAALPAPVYKTPSLAPLLPSYVASAFNIFDPTRSLYNWKPSNTRRQRASLARAANGGLVHHIVLGDSESDNYCGDGVFTRTRMWATRLRDRLVSKTGAPSGGEGFIRAAFAGGTDPRWNIGAWNNTGAYIYSATLNQVATCVTAETCVAIDVYYFDTTGSISVTIDGANTKTAVTTNSGLLKKLSWTGLASTVHTIAITNTATTGTNTFVAGVGAYNASGIVVHNLALYGAQSASWSTTTSFQGIFVLLSLFGGTFGGFTFTPLVAAADVMHYQIGVNDLNASVAIATIIANITITRTAVAAGSIETNLYIQQQPAGLNATQWGAWASALYALADVLDVPLFDIYDRTAGYNAAFFDTMMSADGLHPSQAWQFVQGRLVAEAMTA